MTVLIVDSNNAGVGDMDALAKALVSAGYRVTNDAAAPHDLSARLKVASDAGTKRMSIELSTNGQAPTDVLTGAPSDGRTSDALLEPLVKQIAQAKAMGAVMEARRLRAQKNAAAAQRLHDEHEAEEQRAHDEREAAWAQAGEAECRVPVTSHSCDGVSGFLAVRVEGEHVAEARVLLEAARPRLSMLADDELFVAAQVDACASPKSFDACDRVDQYLKQLPAGRHAPDAQRALAKARPRSPCCAPRPTRERLRPRALPRSLRAAPARRGNRCSRSTVVSTSPLCRRLPGRALEPFSLDATRR